MNKYILIVLFLLIVQIPSFGVNFGYYKAESDYGLIDGFKWNFFNKDKDKPLVQLKSETEEEKIRIEKEKNKPKEVQDDVQLYRFMLDDTVAF